MSLPRVTIMIPTYNQECYILDAVRSALDQTYSALEVIVSDDHSTDGTARLMGQINDPRLRYVRHDQNIGRAANYRYLLYQLASGEYVANLDGDDYYADPQYIEKGIRHLVDHPDCVFYQTDRLALSADGNFTTQTFHFKENRKEMSGIDYFKNSHKLGLFSHSSTIYNARLARSCEFYSFDTLNTDFLSLIKLALHGNVLLIKSPSLVWRIHDYNASHTVSEPELARMKEDIREVARYARQFLSVEECRTWETDQFDKKIKQYVYSMVQRKENPGKVWQVIRLHGHFDFFYLKQLMKSFIQ